jgi:8-oxo-dGTP diphosphatase
VRGYAKGTTAAGELAKLRDAAVSALAAIRATGDPATAFSQLSAMGVTVAEMAEWVTSWQDWMAASMYDSGQVRSFAQLAEIMGVSKTRVVQRVEAGRLKGNPVKDPGTSPEPPVVVAAIIIHPELGVLTVHRVDGVPPYSFPAAEIAPGESPAAALIRRVPQETGLDVDPEYLIDGRLHPRSGHFMRYMLVHLTDPEGARDAASQPGDPDSDRVEWLSAAQTRELMADMFRPVRELIDRELAS